METENSARNETQGLDQTSRVRGIESQQNDDDAAYSFSIVSQRPWYLRALKEVSKRLRNAGST